MNTETLDKLHNDVPGETSLEEPSPPQPKRHVTGLHCAPYRLTPFQQGHLDPLCGEYAIINALRLLTRPNDKLDEDFWGELMAFTLIVADRKYGLRRVLSEGTPQWLFKLLVPEVVSQFNKLTDSGIQIKSLRDLGAGRMPEDAMDTLEAALRRKQAAAIVLLGGYHDHWTVVRAITAGTIWLFDSDGLRSLMRRDVATSYKHRSGQRHVMPQRIIRLLTRS